MGGIVWLASYPKSGNTWTRNFLHNLLDVGKKESHDINKLQSKTAWDSAWQWYKPYLLNKKDFTECSYEEVAAARLRANGAIAEAAGNELLFVKTHNAMAKAHGHLMINPRVTAGAVYIIRNPLDVAISYSHHLDISIDKAIQVMGNSGKVISGGDKMAYEMQGSWTENVFSWTQKESPKMFIMRYEDMLDDPFKTFSSLTKFLQIKKGRNKIQKAIDLSSFKNMKKMESKDGFREKPKDAERFFRKGTKDQWQEDLTKEQVIRIIKMNHVQMKKFDYIPEGYGFVLESV